MQLSQDELARLEQMVDQCKVRSDPAAVSGTDRMLDEIDASVRKKRRAAPSADSAPGKMTVQPGRRDDPTWNQPRSLEELIEIRRILMQDGQPE